MGRADADKHVRSLKRIRQFAAEFFRIGDGSHLCLGRVHLDAFAENAIAVHHFQVLHAQVHQMLANGNARGTGAVDDNLDIVNGLADNPQGIEQRGSHDTGCAMLIIMENRNIADFLQFTFDLEAAGSGDIFQVDAAEAA